MRNYLPLLGGALLLLNSCSQSTELDGDGAFPNFGDEVTFTTPITRMSGDQWESGDKVGLFSGTTYSNLEYEVDPSDGSLSAVDDKIYYLSSDETSYYAYYPYQSGMSGSSYAIDLTDQSDLSKIDLMWDRVSTTDSSIELQFSHLLSKVYLTINNGTNDVPSDLTCSIYGLNIAATINLNYAIYESLYSGTIKNVEGTLSADGKSMTFELLLLPTTQLDDLIFMLTSDSQSIKVINTPSQNEGTVISEWSAGESYNYSADIDTSGSSAIEPTGITLDQEAVSGMLIGETLQLTATITPLYAVGLTADWSSSNTSVATVDSNGLVTTVGPGSAIITASISDSSGFAYTATCDVAAEIAVGDFLYSDMTISSSYNSSKSVLGVIYLINSDGLSGKAMYSAQTANIVWCSSDSAYATTATGVSLDGSATDVGISNMKAVYACDNDFSEFPVYAWVAALNSGITDYSTLSDNATGVYYLPSQGEYVNEIYPAYWAADIAAGTSSYVSTSTMGTNMAAAGGKGFTGGTTYKYVTSTVVSDTNYVSMSWRNSGADESVATNSAKTVTSSYYNVRAVMNFDLTANN